MIHADSGVPLVGAGHKKFVDILTESARETGQGCRIVLLEGPSGVGKSRIIREVYGSLTSKQEDPPYWPSLVDNRENVVQTRKLIGPGRSAFRWSPGAYPNFLWWDISCRISDDRNPSDAITEFAPFLARHVLPAALSVSRDRGVSTEILVDLANSWRSFAKDVGSEGALEVASRIFNLVSGLDTFGLGLAVKELLAAANWLRGRQANQQQLVADVVLDSQRVPLAQSQVDLLESMAARRLPVVIAIEDLHFMGSDTRELLSELHRRNADVLVLGTAWPESRARPEYNAWREGEGKVTTVYSVQPPSPRDTADMVLAFAPRTSRIEARRIAGKWPNPFALLVLLSLKRVQERIVSGGGALVFGEDLVDEPREVEELYRLRLEEMPSEVAEVLAVTTGTLPTAAELFTADFVRALVGRAAVGAGAITEPVESVTARLEEAEREFYWCTDKGAGVSMFTEPPLQMAAHRRWVDESTRQRRQELLQRVVAELEALIDERRGGGLFVPLDDPTAVAACTWLVDLRRAGV